MSAISNVGLSSWPNSLTATCPSTRALESGDSTVEDQLPPPKCPRSIEEAGLSNVLVADLILKFLSVRGYGLGNDLAQDLGLPFRVIEQTLTQLKEQKLVEVAGGELLGPISYRFALTEAGRERARAAIAQCAYIGPAPVTLEQYTVQARLQTVKGVACNRATLGSVFTHLVLAESLLDELGPAVVSGRSIFFYGPPGSGKTAISRALGDFLNRYGGDVWIPHAFLVENSIVTIYDPLLHRVTATHATAPRSQLENLFHTPEEAIDRRWLRIKRPVVVVGGELTLETLDLRYNQTSNIYQSPLHVKANGGVFLIDDFGRQIVSPRNLLNRWILPLEERQDFLTLATGKKIAVPFEQLVLFSTNLEPSQLVDDAFLRRIRHKIFVPSPTRDTFERIFEKVCENMGMPYKPEIVQYLYDRYYEKGREPRSSDSRDLLEIVESICRFRGNGLELHEGLIEEAARRFFANL